jgi:hypothetical protein
MVAQFAEVEVSRDGAVGVRRVVCAVSHVASKEKTAQRGGDAQSGPAASPLSRNAASSFMRLDKPPPKEKNYAACGAMAMATAAEYRQWAEECFKWARDASDEDVRESYTKMGQHWLECAERASSQQGSVASAMTRRKSD